MELDSEAAYVLFRDFLSATLNTIQSLIGKVHRKHVVKMKKVHKISAKRAALQEEGNWGMDTSYSTSFPHLPSCVEDALISTPLRHH